MQVCLGCGMERESKVSFDSPHYHKTQDRAASCMPSDLRIAADTRLAEAVAFFVSETVAARPAAGAGRDVRPAIQTGLPAYS